MTVIHTLADADFGDNTMRVLSNDDYANVGTALLLDFSKLKCWAGGAPGPSSQALNLTNKPTIRGAFQPSSQPSFADGAMVFNGAATSTNAMLIQKDAAVGVPFFPNGDGDFADTLMICWFTPTARPASNAGILGMGRTGGTAPAMGFQHHASGNIYEYSMSHLVSVAEPNGVKVQIAAHYQYDEVAGTTTIRLYRNGVFLSQIAGSNPNSLTQDSNSKAFIGGFAGASNGFNGAIHRVVIDQTSVSGLDPDDLVAQDWALVTGG